jgi:hypothetical protein
MTSCLRLVINFSFKTDSFFFMVTENGESTWLTIVGTRVVLRSVLLALGLSYRFSLFLETLKPICELFSRESLRNLFSLSFSASL